MSTDPGNEVVAVLAPVEVTRERIAGFADAVGDTSPAYRSPAAARALGHRDVIAPPTFAIRLSGQAEELLLGGHPLGYDYSSAIHLAQDFRYTRPITAGDVLVARARIVRAQEAMGGGLLTMEVVISDMADETVVVTTSRLLSTRRAVTDRPPPDSPSIPDTGGLSAELASALAEFISEDDFACLGAKAALRRKAVLHRHCGELGGEPAVLAHLEGLSEFLKTFEPSARSFTSYVATFDELPDTSEQFFEDTIWRHLQAMHDQDSRSHPWSDQYDADPSSKRFGFSVNGHPFFIVGLHPGASRPGRRFRTPTLVFNSHIQFNAMGNNFFKLRRKIRERERAFHGEMNPSLATYRDEARHYSGRMTPLEWTCPFVPHGIES
ncbi:guanitoxin biosynthesis heme-dependent pre-guanitoxin N-hydroxylase GntA [Streptomyces violascens]|uniref:guanitoxin biosynthesis heme-dependent pre-guanitoxin N-hydroxylase GntA n=1 Tax=Streptomyces violascens TaxID=67381 RepID=UPI00368C5F58